MEPEAGIAAIAHVIQVAVAPVFLLSGIGAMLAVMTSRLSRIIDRARFLEDRLAEATGEAVGRLHDEIATLSRRARLINASITLCTFTALLVCMVIALLFLGAFFAFDAAVPIASLFIAAMAAFAGGLIVFLREIFLGTATLRLGTH